MYFLGIGELGSGRMGILTTRVAVLLIAQQELAFVIGTPEPIGHLGVGQRGPPGLVALTLTTLHQAVTIQYSSSIRKFEESFATPDANNPYQGLLASVDHSKWRVDEFPQCRLIKFRHDPTDIRVITQRLYPLDYFRY